MKQRGKSQHLSYRELREVRERLSQAIDTGDRENAVALAGRYGDEAACTGEDKFLLGRVAYMNQQWKRAEYFFRQALQEQDLPKWCRGAVSSILAELLQKTGRVKEATSYYEVSLSCKDLTTGWAEEYSNYLFHLHYLNYPQETMLEKAKGYANAFKNIPQYQHLPLPRHEKIRIGYVSPDFCRHIVAFFSYAFIHAYDHVCFEVYCYTNCQEDAVSEDFKRQVDGWRNVRGKSWQEIAACIHEDEIDILVDLAGHTANNMLPVFAYKPAPIQMSGIGYFDTTGLSQIDYFLADHYTDPKENEQFFTEKLLRLPHSHFCYMWHDAPGNPGPLPAGQNGYITFGCLNNIAKINDQVLQVWSRILQQVPASRLYLKAKALNQEYAREMMIEKMHQAGIRQDQVVFAEFESDYLHAYQEIDIALDTFPYPGGGTTCDALYMGVPVITLCGNRHNARFGYSLLMNAGLQACCAQSLDEYVQKAVELSNDIAGLKEIRQTLRRKLRQSPVMDMGHYMIEVEAVYYQLYQEWIAREWTVKQKKKNWDRLQIFLKKAFEKKEWENVIRLGGALMTVAAYRKPFAAAVGRGYLNLPIADWCRMTWYFQQADMQKPERKIEYSWLSGMGENRQLHHVQAEKLYQVAEDTCARMQKKANKETMSFWQNQAFRMELKVQEAVNSLVMGRVLDSIKKYRQSEQLATSFHDHCQLYGSWLMALHHQVIKPEAMLSAHTGFQRLFSGVKYYTHSSHATHDRIRIGYLSGDFRYHVMFYFYYQLLIGHDDRRFKIYAYYLNQCYDGFTQLVKEAVDVWREVPVQDPQQTARQIYEDEIDILVDLGGHSSGTGLPALGWKPAPIQISGLGYMDTTGLKAVDYLITDTYCDPIGQKLYISEKPLYLSSMFCYTGRSDLPVCQGAPCLYNGYITFGIFNRYQKITDEMLQLWLIIQHQVKGAKLLLKAEAFLDDGIGDMAYDRMKKMGFDMERVIFEPSSEDYMERYLSVDIALDTFPYVGGGTTCDALYMGVPVISRYGEGRASRFGLSLLKAVGLGELAAADSKDYVQRAIALATDRELLDGLHKNLRTMMLNSRLMDTVDYVHEMETAYGKIWQEYQEDIK